MSLAGEQTVAETRLSGAMSAAPPALRAGRMRCTMAIPM